MNYIARCNEESLSSRILKNFSQNDLCGILNTSSYFTDTLCHLLIYFRGWRVKTLCKVKFQNRIILATAAVVQNFEGPRPWRFAYCSGKGNATEWTWNVIGGI